MSGTFGPTACVPYGTLRSLLPLDGFIAKNKELLHLPRQLEALGPSGN